jgi:hypothetical protein
MSGRTPKPVKRESKNIEYLWMSLAQRRRLRRVSLCLFNEEQMIEYITSTFDKRSQVQSSPFRVVFFS